MSTAADQPMISLNGESVLVYNGEVYNYRELTSRLGQGWVQAVRSYELCGRVFFFGAKSDVRAYLEAANFFVSLSLHEGLGIAALEAMSVGLPVVAYRTGPLPEVVIAGENGLLVPLEDEEGLANAIKSLVLNPQQCVVLGEAGWRRVHEHFSIVRTARQYAQLYRDLGRREQSAPARRVIDRME
jgi:glycosyltransferase involved in cell wall biosynthesis